MESVQVWVVDHVVLGSHFKGHQGLKSVIEPFQSIR